MDCSFDCIGPLVDDLARRWRDYTLGLGCIARPPPTLQQVAFTVKLVMISAMTFRGKVMVCDGTSGRHDGVCMYVCMYVWSSLNERVYLPYMVGKPGRV